MSAPSSWYYTWENRPRGPVDDAGLQVLAQQGFITVETWLWHAPWITWQQVKSADLVLLASGVSSPTAAIESPPTLPQEALDSKPLPPLPVPFSSPPKPPLKRTWRQLVFNLLVFCAAFAALAGAFIPLLSSGTLPFSVPVAIVAMFAVGWANASRTPKSVPALALCAALSAIALGVMNYRIENRHKPSLTELLAIHDHGTPAP